MDRGFIPVAIAGATARHRGNLHHRRAAIERLVDRARHLPPEDRAILELVYREGQTITAVAQDRGESIRGLQRRVQRLVRRLHSKPYVFVGQHLDLLPKHLQATAKARYLHGLPLRAIAKRTGKSLHHVRMNVHTLDTLIKAGVFG